MLVESVRLTLGAELQALKAMTAIAYMRVLILDISIPALGVGVSRQFYLSFAAIHMYAR
ncbi:hypothetical protein GCM10009092_29260 [Bowmanella denitrificans]|uniref:Uncharacterized protein n=1 Tax=Bowmanella denitrificans TaxID=366582 RepID=A0ABN0XFP0_9ALTE